MGSMVLSGDDLQLLALGEMRAEIEQETLQKFYMITGRKECAENLAACLMP